MPYVSRKDIALTREEVDDFLRGNVWGRLATAGLDLEPHLTPLGYVYYDGAIWFHGLRSSRRGRQIAENPRWPSSSTTASRLATTTPSAGASSSMAAAGSPTTTPTSRRRAPHTCAVWT